MASGKVAEKNALVRSEAYNENGAASSAAAPRASMAHTARLSPASQTEDSPSSVA